MVIPDKTAIIGKIPGYNANIDNGGKFEKELLKGITFIDLRPMTYELGDFLNQSTGEIFNDMFADIEKAYKTGGLFKKNATKSKEIFHKILKRMDKDFDLSSDFKDVDMIRIIGANDSTFTEQFSNSFAEENGLASLVGTAKNKVSSGKLGIIQKALKSYSHAGMISLAAGVTSGLNSLSHSPTATELAAGVAFGMNMAAPTIWNGSQYTSTLSIFLKLVAPIGTEECIRRNIVEPMMYLLAAASPLTYSGIMYGFPLLWDIQAHGITNFRIGAIAAISFIRGSFETTFNVDMQPTVIDVRITLVPLLNDFAVQPAHDDDDSEGGPAVKSIYTDHTSLGVQHPGDVITGTLNDYQNGLKAGDKILTIKL